MYKENSKRRLFLFYIPLILLIIFSLFPFIWTFITSIKPNEELFTNHVQYIPKNPTLDNYVELFKHTTFPKNMFNSFLIATVTAIVSLFVSLLAAYGFSRFKFRGKYIFLVAFLSINMFPPVLLLIPLYSLMRMMGLLYTPYSLIIAYSTFTIPFSVWLLTGYLDDLPVSLDEAAMVDGCSRMQAFYRVILPLTTPGIIATGIYIFITAWNEFIFAVMFTNQNSMTIPVALQSFIGQFNVQWGMLTAGGTVTTIPILILFMLIEKKLVEGLTAGAVKG